MMVGRKPESAAPPTATAGAPSACRFAGSHRAAGLPIFRSICVPARSSGWRDSWGRGELKCSKPCSGSIDMLQERWSLKESRCTCDRAARPGGWE